MADHLSKTRFPRWLIAAICLVSVAVLAGGSWFYVDQQDRARKTSEDSLASIAQLKVDQIVQWRSERLADAQLLASAPLFSELVARWRETGAATDKQQILDWLQNIQDRYDYADTALVDPNGAPLLDTGGDDGALTPTGLAGVQAAVAGDAPLLTDLHFDSKGTIHIDAIAPLFTGGAGSRKAVGAVVLHANASDFLYPLIQSWPTPSPTAETLLVRREGDTVLFLNELRFQSDTALKLSFPLSRTNVPAVLAVEGKQGLVQATDYRGVRVLADLQPIPGSPWFMVAKVDTSEVYGGTVLRASLIFGLMFVLLVAIIGGSSLAWQWGLKRRYREAYAAETARRGMLERFEHVVKQAADIILLADQDQRIVEANDLAVQEYGYSPQEFLQLSIPDLLSTEASEDVESHLASVEASSVTVRESSHRRKDGSVFPVEVSDAAISLGGKTYYQAIVRDITERKQAEETLRENEEQLRQAQKMEAVGQLAGGIAHDFNNLLTAILGYSELMLMRPELAGSPALEELQQIRRAAERAGTLTKQILAFSRRQPLSPRVVSLNEILEGMGPLLRRTLGENIELVSLEHPDLGHAELDVHQFEQVLTNLALNARDAMPEGGRLTLETSNVELDEEYCRSHPEACPGPYVMLAVSDTGTGMDNGTLDRIFEPFYTTKAPGEGTGLGLAMVHGVVKQSGGSICVYSELGRGTSFKIYLPQVAAKEPAKVITQPDRLMNSGTEVVMVVEDESSLRDLITRVLGDMGYVVASFATADEALVEVERGRPFDLLITDVVLPGVLQGNTLAERVVALQPELPVLYMSGYTRNAIVHAGRLDEGVNFLEKPFTPDALLRKVRQVLDQARETDRSKRGRPRSR